MSEDLASLLEAFDGAGLSRGSMNGKSLGFISDPGGGYKASSGQVEFLKDLRDYEKRSGKGRSWR